MEDIDDLLIATSRGFYMLQREIFTQIHQDFGRYYGITWDEEKIYLVARRTYRVPRKKGAENILVLKSSQSEPGNFVWIGEIQGQDLDAMHQIYFYDGQLFICNTGVNRIDVLTAERAEDRYAKHLPIRDVNYSMTGWKYEPGNHVNSIWIDGGVIYVAEHRKGPSKVRCFDAKSQFAHECGVMEIGEKIHNVYVENNQMFVCSSGVDAECIIIRDLSTGKDRVINTSQYAKGPPRGLARTQGRWYIGISQRAVRSERHSADYDGAVLVFDDDFNLIKRIDLKNVGQLHEIRAMTGLDRAHNGIPFPAPQRARSETWFANANLTIRS